MFDLLGLLHLHARSEHRPAHQGRTLRRHFVSLLNKAPLLLVLFVSHGLEFFLTHELIVSVLENFVCFAPGLLDSFEGAFFLLFKKVDSVVHLLDLFFDLLPRVSYA